MKKIAINGFGRIGRLAYRELSKYNNVEVVAINDLTSPATLAYLLQYDSAQGLYKKGKIKATDNSIIIEGKEIKVFAERNPQDLPWGELGIDLVIESTGIFRTKEKANMHIEAGAKKVVISAPASGDLKTIVYGVNHKELNSEDKIISGASCTTNCLVPVSYVLEKEFGIVKGLMTTVHAATNDQKILDLPHVDLRRGRAVFSNIIPTHTGAAVAVAKVLPQLDGKLDGFALRIPSITGSVVDLTVELKKDVTVEEVNAAMEKYANAELNRVLEYNKDAIVSVDVKGSSYGSIFDSTTTKVMTVDNKQLVKILAWYDNELSYVSQMIRTTLHFINL